MTLGNTSSSLSFKQKVDLLIDLGALDSDTKKKFQTFMEIRNQFMHNWDALDYVTCFSFLPPGKDSFLLRSYPQRPSLSMEDKLEAAVKELCIDITDMTVQIIKKIDAKYIKKGMDESNENVVKVLLGSLDRIQHSIDEIVKELSQDADCIDPLTLAQVSGKVIKSIKNIWAEDIGAIPEQ